MHYFFNYNYLLTLLRSGLQIQTSYFMCYELIVLKGLFCSLFFLTCKREQKWFSVSFSHLLLLSFCSMLSISGELKTNCTICTADAVPSHDVPWNSCMTLRRLDTHIPFIPKLHTNIKPGMHIKKSNKGEKQNF